MDFTASSRQRQAEWFLELGRDELAAGRAHAALTSAQLAIALWPYEPVAIAARALTCEALARANQRSTPT
ncbi:MAG: hypothetical protein MUC96_06965 [Myxococcaceae bacterium]|jgi:hypothetical protein|nr:hypothetical protein [Myxococcaceae bacterium]